MPGLQAAHHMIWGRLMELEAAAAARGDVLVQTAFENYTGSFDFDFVVRRAAAIGGHAWVQLLGAAAVCRDGHGVRCVCV